MKQAYSFITITIITFLCSCHKETPNSIGSGSIIVINEGGFGHGNADLSVYNPSTKTVFNNVFSQENGFAMGDVAQSLYLIGDTAFIVMNNSQKVVIAKASQNFKYISSISLPNSSPRYFLPVDSRRAYVTELYSNKIWVVDYRADTLIKSIPVTGWTEQMVSWSGKIYVEEATTPSATYGTGSTSPPVHAVLMIDPASDQIVNSVSLQSDPGSIALTGQNKLFVLSPQQTSPLLVSASLYEIDMASFSIQHQFNYSPTRYPNYIRYSSVSNQLMYADSGGIFVMQPTDTIIPPNPFIVSQGWNIYGLNPDPVTGDIYISDAVDYQQASHIWRYSQTGVNLDHFNAGIISNGFVFE
jgi:hypothetical protein